MKKIGLIGGVGPESTIEYYRLIIKEFRERLSTSDYPEMLINSINLTEMLVYINNRKYKDLIKFLLDKIQTLEQGGADFAAIASNTPHIVFDEVQEKTNLKLISIVEATCKALKKKDITCTGLFGTKSTMTAGFYKKEVNKYGIEVIVPAPESQDYIHDKYMNELVFNIIKKDTKKGLIEIAEKLRINFDIEGLILGGTELPLILKQDDFKNIEVFDTTNIHVNSIVSYAILK